MYRKLTLVVIFLSVAILSCFKDIDAYTPGKIRLEPNVVHIGATFNGLNVKLTGDIPVGAEAVVRVSGQSADLVFKKKGKALGFLWMNIGSVVFHNCPKVYLIYASNTLSKAWQSRPEDLVDLDVGFEALKRHVDISPKNENKDLIFKELIKLKEKQGLFGVHGDAVRYGKAGVSSKPFNVFIRVPPRMTPGTYRVDVICVKDGAKLFNTSHELKISEVGFPAMLASLAFGHGALYGIIAAFVAIIAGLIMGLIFKGGKSAH